MLESELNDDVPTPLILWALGGSMHIFGKILIISAVWLVPYSSPPLLITLFPIICCPCVHSKWENLLTSRRLYIL